MRYRNRQRILAALILAGLLAMLLCPALMGQTTQPIVVDLSSGDQTEALQAAIDRAPDGATVEFRGTYSVRQLAIKSRKNLTLRNLSLAATTQPSQSVPMHGPAVVLVEASAGITLENLRLDGKRVNAIGVGIVKSTGTKIIGGQIAWLGNSTAAIQSYGDFDTLIDGTFILDIANVDGHSRGIWLGNVHENGAANSTRPTVRNCIIQRTGTPGDGTGIAGHVLGVTVEDCYITDTGGAGIKFADGSRDIAIRRTTCLRNDFHGIQLSQANISGVLIEDCDLSRNRIAGLYLWGASNVTLKRVRGDGNKFGMLVEAGLANWLSSDVSFVNNSSGVAQRLVK